MLTDTHCHLDFKSFDADRDAVVERALKARIERILVPGINPSSSMSAVNLAENHPRLYAAVGVHPTEIKTWQGDTLHLMSQLAMNKKVLAIGEIGLDYYWDSTSHDRQKQLLKEQLDLAADLNLPVLIHFREKGDAGDGECASDLLMLLEEWIAALGVNRNPLVKRPGVLHAFSGSEDTAWKAIRMNFCLGVTGPVTYRKDRQELISELPLEKLLLETDSPFLTPHPNRGKRNEPANITLIADKIALLHSVSSADVAEITSANAARLFDW